MTVVEVCSAVYGDLAAVAVELTEREAVVEMGYLPPVGTELTLRIQAADYGEDGELVLQAVAIGHHYDGERRLVRMRLGQAPVDARCDHRASVH